MPPQKTLFQDIRDAFPGKWRRQDRELLWRWPAPGGSGSGVFCLTAVVRHIHSLIAEEHRAKGYAPPEWEGRTIGDAEELNPLLEYAWLSFDGSNIDQSAAYRRLLLRELPQFGEDVPYVDAAEDALMQDTLWSRRLFWLFDLVTTWESAIGAPKNVTVQPSVIAQQSLVTYDPEKHASLGDAVNFHVPQTGVSPAVCRRSDYPLFIRVHVKASGRRLPVASLRSFRLGGHHPIDPSSGAILDGEAPAIYHVIAAVRLRRSQGEADCVQTFHLTGATVEPLIHKMGKADGAENPRQWTVGDVGYDYMLYYLNRQEEFPVDPRLRQGIMHYDESREPPVEYSVFRARAAAFLETLGEVSAAARLAPLREASPVVERMPGTESAHATTDDASAGGSAGGSGERGEAREPTPDADFGNVRHDRL